MGSGSGGCGQHTISVTPWQLEYLICLAEGLARMRYSRVVTTKDDAFSPPPFALPCCHGQWSVPLERGKLIDLLFHTYWS
eukprot:8760232-Ditylum_brightwellii.AAC.1